MSEVHLTPISWYLGSTGHTQVILLSLYNIYERFSKGKNNQCKRWPDSRVMVSSRRKLWGPPGRRSIWQLDASKCWNLMFRGSTKSPNVQEYRYAKNKTIQQVHNVKNGEISEKKGRRRTQPVLAFQPSNAAILGLLELSNCIDYESRATKVSEDMQHN